MAICEHGAESYQCSSSCDGTEEWPCGPCSTPPTLRLEIPLEEAGILTITAFAYDDENDIEGSIVQASPLRPKVIPEADVTEIRVPSRYTSSTMHHGSGPRYERYTTKLMSSATQWYAPFRAAGFRTVVMPAAPGISTRSVTGSRRMSSTPSQM